MPRTFASTTLIGGAGSGTGPDAARVDVLIGRRGGALEIGLGDGPRHAPAGPPRLRRGAPPRAPRPAADAVRGNRRDPHRAARAPQRRARRRPRSPPASPARSRRACCRPRPTGELLLIVAVWVDPAATDADEVFANHLAATFEAIAAAVHGTPTMDEVLAEARHPWNAYYHRHRN